MAKVRLFALYLPQYYPNEFNNKYWGEGFTEWHNVVKAKPLFKGHMQPHLPSSLGFYDLRLDETRVAQAELAKQNGIEAFCYWHYWFGNGKRLLERPFDDVVKSKSPDFPFCLAWANHSWYAKTWDHNKPNKLLIEQKYLGEQDYENHFYSLLDAFKDKRYVRVNGKLFFMIFSPLSSSEISTFIAVWRKLAKINELGDFYFVGQGFKNEKKQILNLGFDSFQDNSVFSIYRDQSIFSKNIKRLIVKIFKRPAKIFDYSKVMKSYESPDFSENNVIPSIIPNWDHSPRSKERGLILTNSTPQKFKEHVKSIFSLINNKPKEEKIAIIKSWNEWGEGNYLEPDQEFGQEYLKVIKNENE